MYIMEKIRLSGQPFPKPLPRPAKKIVAMLASHGYLFKDMGRTILLTDVFVPGRFEHVKELLAKKKLNLKIDYSRWPVIEEKDYEQSPLWMLVFPDIWIDDIDLSKKCEKCGRRIEAENPAVSVNKVKSKEPVGTVNTHFTIVNSMVKEEMSKSLKGCYFSPFDEEGEYHVLQSQSSVGELTNPPDDFIGYKGVCLECQQPDFDVFVGPYKYSKHQWNGDDIVSGAFSIGLLFTKKAYDLLISLGVDASREGVVILTP